MAALVGVFFIDQQKGEELRLRTLETAMGMNWRLNDVIVEALTTDRKVQELVLDDLATPEERQESFEAVQLSFEILWSNIELARGTDLDLYLSFDQLLRELMAYLVEVDPTLFADEMPDEAFLSEFGGRVSDYCMALQKKHGMIRSFTAFRCLSLKRKKGLRRPKTITANALSWRSLDCSHCIWFLMPTWRGITTAKKRA